MDKKSAIATAGGLVASFVAGVAAVSFNWGLGGVSTASPPATPSPSQPAKVKPIVKHRTITIHKKAPAPKPTPSSQTIVLAAPAATAPAPVATTSGSHAAGDDEGEHEHEGGGDD
jgi:hypothetical protein